MGLTAPPPPEFRNKEKEPGPLPRAPGETMTATAIDSRLNQALQFYDAPIGKKVVMAVTGAILFGFVLGADVGALDAFETGGLDGREALLGDLADHLSFVELGFELGARRSRDEQRRGGGGGGGEEGAAGCFHGFV